MSFRSSVPDRLRDQRPETGSIPGSSTERAAGERPFLFGLPCRISTPIKIRANPVAHVVRLSFWSHTATFAVLASEPCPAPLRPLGPSVPGRCAPIGGQLTCAHSRRSGPLHKWLLDGPAAPGCPAHPRRHRNRSSAPAKCPKRNHSSKFPVLVTPGGVTSVKMRPYSYVPAWPNFQLVLGFDASAPIFVWHIGVFPGCLCAQAFGSTSP